MRGLTQGRSGAARSSRGRPNGVVLFFTHTYIIVTLTVLRSKTDIVAARLSRAVCITLRSTRATYRVYDLCHEGYVCGSEAITLGDGTRINRMIHKQDGHNLSISQYHHQSADSAADDVKSHRSREL